MDFGDWQRHFLAAALLLVMAGCAAVPQSLELAKEPGNLPRRVMLDDVAFFPQVKYQCGPAALATVLSHRSVDVVPENLIEKVYIPERKGSLQIEMVATARSYGKLAYPLENQLKALLAELAAGNPVLVFQNLALSVWPQWHYAVAVGYDLAYDLERAGFGKLALDSYRGAATKWPDNVTALMALGNSEYSMGNMARAQSVFTRVIQQQPEDGSAWNNMAYALAAGGCHQAAVSAVQCASQLAPTDNNIMQSLSEISAMDNSYGESCQILNCPIELTIQ